MREIRLRMISNLIYEGYCINGRKVEPNRKLANIIELIPRMGINPRDIDLITLDCIEGGFIVLYKNNGTAKRIKLDRGVRRDLENYIDKYCDNCTKLYSTYSDLAGELNMAGAYLMTNNAESLLR